MRSSFYVYFSIAFAVFELQKLYRKLVSALNPAENKSRLPKDVTMATTSL